MEQQNGETEFKATGITQLFKEVWTIDEEKLKKAQELYAELIEIPEVKSFFDAENARGIVFKITFMRLIFIHTTPFVLNIIFHKDLFLS